MPVVLGFDVDLPMLVAAVLHSGDLVPVDLPAVDSVAEGDDAVVVAAVRSVIDARDDAAVVLAHPAEWSAERVLALGDAFDQAGLGRVRLISAAVAAAVDRSTRADIPADSTLAVVELRRAGIDVAVLRRMTDGSFAQAVAAQPIAGLDQAAMDDALLVLVAAGVDGGLPEPGQDERTDAALTRLRAAARIARQRLAGDDSTFVSVRLPGRATVVKVERAAFEAAVADRVRAVIPALAAAIDDVAIGEIFVEGAAAPAALIAQLLAAELGRPVVADETVLAVVHGAARLADELGAEAVAPPGMPAPAPSPGLGSDSGAISEPEAESTDDTVDPAVVRLRSPASGYLSAGPTEERRRGGVLRYWPVMAAAAGLVLLGGAAAAVTLSPGTTMTDPFIGTSGTGSGEIVHSDRPIIGAPGASSSSLSDDPNVETAPKKDAIRNPAVPVTGGSSSLSSPPATSSDPPSPSVTDSPSPPPTDTDPPSPSPPDTGSSDPADGVPAP